MTPSQEFIERYKQIEREADSLGRIIGVGRLRVSQQIKIMEMTPGLEGDSEIAGPDGATSSMPRRALPMLAAAVREIDGNRIPFPRNRAELDAMIDRLDEPGLSAVIKAMAKFVPLAVEAPLEAEEIYDELA